MQQDTITRHQANINTVEACNDIHHAMSLPLPQNPISFYKATPTGAGGVLQSLEKELQLIHQEGNDKTQKSALLIHSNLTHLTYKEDYYHNQTAAEGFDSLLAEYEEGLEQVLSNKKSNNKQPISETISALQEHQRSVLGERVRLKQEQSKKEQKFCVRHSNIKTTYGESMREFYAQHPDKEALWQQLLANFYLLQSALKNALQETGLSQYDWRNLQLTLIDSYNVESALLRIHTPLLKEWDKKSAHRFFSMALYRFSARWVNFNQFLMTVLRLLRAPKAITAHTKIQTILKAV